MNRRRREAPPEETVAELYRVFGSCRLGDDFAGCSCCVPGEESKRLRRMPLHSLGVADLNRYAFKAMTTWGDARHFKHFLPRLLELSLDEFPRFDFPETLMGKLALTEWTTWPPRERAAVHGFLRAFWRHHLDRPSAFPPRDDIRTVVGGLAETGISLRPFLDDWLEAGTEPAGLRLAEFIDAVGNEVVQSGSVRFRTERPERGREIVTWLRTDAVRHRLRPLEESIGRVYPDALFYLDLIRSTAG